MRAGKHGRLIQSAVALYRNTFLLSPKEAGDKTPLKGRCETAIAPLQFLPATHQIGEAKMRSRLNIEHSLSTDSAPVAFCWTAERRCRSWHKATIRLRLTSGAIGSCAGHRIRGHCALSAMLTVSQLSKSFAGQALFDDVGQKSDRSSKIVLT